MKKIQQQLQKIEAEKRLGLMTHLVLGYPNLTTSQKIAQLMSRVGVDFIELQIPFSDPMGDGPIIRQANSQSLKAGFRVKDSFGMAKKLTVQDKITTPLLFMTYYNIIFHYGVEKFCQATKNCGVSGLIVPDYNPAHENREKLGHYCKLNNLELISFVSPKTSSHRLKTISQDSSSFIYCFSAQAVTGYQKDLNKNLGSYLKNVKRRTKKPLAVGFGVATPSQVQALRGKAEIAIVGSALLSEYQKSGRKGLKIKVKKLIKALH